MVGVTRSGRRYDVILDNVEAQPLAITRRALAPTGTLIPNSGKGGRWFGPLGRIFAAQVLAPFTRARGDRKTPIAPTPPGRSHAAPASLRA